MRKYNESEIKAKIKAWKENIDEEVACNGDLDHPEPKFQREYTCEWIGGETVENEESN